MCSYIEVKNVSKSFDHRTVLEDVSLSVDRGKETGLRFCVALKSQTQAAFLCAERNLGSMGGIFPLIWECLSTRRDLSVSTVAFKI